MKQSQSKSYKHKLNMLNPGIIFCKIIATLCVCSFLLHLLKLSRLSAAMAVTAGVVTAVFVILLFIEQHQDRVLYEQAKKENPDIK